MVRQVLAGAKVPLLRPCPLCIVPEMLKEANAIHWLAPQNVVDALDSGEWLHVRSWVRMAGAACNGTMEWPQDQMATAPLGESSACRDHDPAVAPHVPCG